MSFSLSPELSLGKVVLNVQDLWRMLTFYQDKVGLDVIESSDHHAVLGIAQDGSELLELRTSTNPMHTEPKAGLYHTAFLVPSRRDLANVLFSLITQKNIDVEGASDHGYSEAIYFTDPEGNGIEIYRDKPKDQWTILEDGTIPGVTKAMDANGVLAEKDSDVYDHMPTGTVIGHVHLMVSDIDQSRNFYRDTLGLGVKFEAGQAVSFLAAGEYHHHLAINIWGSQGAENVHSGDIGLNHFSVNLHSKDEFDQLKDHIQTNHELFEDDADSFKVYDPNGIVVKISHTV